MSNFNFIIKLNFKFKNLEVILIGLFQNTLYFIRKVSQ